MIPVLIKDAYLNYVIWDAENHVNMTLFVPGYITEAMPHLLIM